MTLRAFLIGLFTSVLVSLWPAYTTYILRSARADYAHLSVAILLPFLVLLLVNSCFSRTQRGLAPSELILIASMGMVAALAQGEWLAGYFLGVITAPVYFASPENGWADTLLTRLPEWSVVADRHAAIAFYEGLAPGASFPWVSWMSPLFWWGCFFVAFFTANFCLVVVFRRQWMDCERLPFPLSAGLLKLTGESGQQGALMALWRDPRFKIGFFVVFCVFAWDIASWFTDLIPPIKANTDRQIFIGEGFPYLRFKANPMTIAFGYFTESNVLFSIWFFHLLTVLQVGLMNRLGFEMGSSDPWCSYHPAVGWQSFGGLLVFVVWGLWVARDHLSAVCRKAFTARGGDVDDSGELFSYRAAVFIFLACVLFSVLFFVQLGLSGWSALTFWGATLVLYIGLARIIVETGLIYLRTPITAQAFTWHLLGTTGIGPMNAMALGLAYTFIGDAKTLGVTTLAHIPSLGMAMDQRRRRRVPLAVGLAFIAGALAVFTFIIFQGNYTVGSYNFGSVSFNGSGDGGIGVWRLAASRIRDNAFATDWTRLGFLGFGAVLTLGLYALRYRFPALALHPIGFAISASDVLRSGIASIFMVWLTKTLILRFGGLENYRRNTPLFMGFMIGFLAAIACGAIVDFIWFPGRGHKINGW